MTTATATAATWADGSPITDDDRDHRPGQVRVREDLHALMLGCQERGLFCYEGESYGSRYLYIDVKGFEVKVRISDHSNCSALHELPTFNVAPIGHTVAGVLDAIDNARVELVMLDDGGEWENDPIHVLWIDGRAIDKYGFDLTDEIRP